MMLAALILAAVCPVPAGWSAPAPVAVEMLPGRAATIALAPSAAKPGTFEGAVTLTVARAGRYALAIDQRAWVDVVQGGATLASVDHRHGEACTGIAKLVVFELAAGTYRVRLDGSPAQQVKLLVSADR